MNVFRSFLWTFRWRIGFVFLAKTLLMIPNMADPFFIKALVEAIEKKEGEFGDAAELKSVMTLVALYMLKKVVQNLIQEHCWVSMNEMG